ncbi:MAG: TOBE domain-containing protein, partial [Bacteroidales bacterium]|nr:TOBE domain-containing protein [Bacteroidales bacterium]
FEKVDLLDHEEGADLTGNVVFILYMGNHYHLTVKTETGENIWVDTNDIWDKGDFVGIKILPQDIQLSKPAAGNE